ncbi:MAG: membrane protein insertion efficiency factor YidD [Candidatus Sungbacteria bacterium]|uniref:Putative membrane protein insertion efficiency factor n=1 Tax=Candidatus Sungiibacteriota bacterium TaxID=2750080 RepID=A0A9D6QVF8_9BACT|nr:membrane protein insertion efficiency factor YidD [Candidatus Sungbacteria bacterium]
MKFTRAIFHFYRTFFSPAWHGLFGPGAGCRYYPTCSRYAERSIQNYGLWRGSLKAGRRILSCNPFSKGGFDPVI